MKLLIVCATDMELIRPLPALPAGVTADVLITGVGMVATTYALTRRLAAEKYDFVLQAGVGGSFDRNIALGDVVLVTSERYGDLGAEDRDEWLDIFSMGLVDRDAAPHSGGALINPLSSPVHHKINLPHASGLTVNAVSGNVQTIARRADLYNCTVESMEGVALHYVCLQENIPFAQVRAISNYITPRDKSQWRMKDAIINLNKWVGSFISSL